MIKTSSIFFMILNLCLFVLTVCPVHAYADHPLPPDGGGRHHDTGRGHPPAPKHERVQRGHSSGAAVAVAAGAVTVAVLADVALHSATPLDDVYVWGVGVRGFGHAASELRTGGGVGAYVWVRPIRWISVEAYTDLILNERRCNGESTGYLRVPLYAGVRAHIFDYRAYDIYGAIAGGVNFQFGPDGRDGLGGGIHVGGGASFKAHKFDIGFDIRYTVESNALDFDRSAIHGCTFAITMGFAA